METVWRVGKHVLGPQEANCWISTIEQDSLWPFPVSRTQSGKFEGQYPQLNFVILSVFENIKSEMRFFPETGELVFADFVKDA